MYGPALLAREGMVIVFLRVPGSCFGSAPPLEREYHIGFCVCASEGGAEIELELEGEKAYAWRNISSYSPLAMPHRTGLTNLPDWLTLTLRNKKSKVQSWYDKTFIWLVGNPAKLG